MLKAIFKKFFYYFYYFFSSSSFYSFLNRFFTHVYNILKNKKNFISFHFIEFLLKKNLYKKEYKNQSKGPDERRTIRTIISDWIIVCNEKFVP